MFAALARCMYRRRARVLAAWAVVLIGIVAISAVLGGNPRTDYSIPGSQSALAHELLAERFPEHAGDVVQLVFSAPDGVEDASVAARIEATLTEAATVPHVRDVRTEAVSSDGTVALASVQLSDTTEKVPVTTVEAVMELAARASGGDLTVEAGGFAVQNAEYGEAGSEQIGLIAALVILLIAFGSLLAAGLPILVALCGIGIALSAVTLLEHVFMIPDWAPSIVTMISLGVGIDYALFIVTRYRAALADGLDPEAAVVTAMSTAGRAVVFAGGTVVISLLGLCTMGMEYLYGTAAATVTGVLVVLCAAMTLLPALLAYVGDRIDRLRVPFAPRERSDGGVWERWSRVVQRRPMMTGVAALAGLLVVAAPFTDLRFGYPDGGTGSEHLTSRRAYDVVSRAFGPGANGPLLVAVDLADDPAAVDRVRTDLELDPGIVGVLPPQVSADGDAAAIIAIPATGPQDPATVALIHHLRDDVLPTAADADPATVYLGGSTAAAVDENEFMAKRLPWLIVAVIALSFLLLLAVFRSVLVAVKAAIMNVLAIGSAYGIMAMALSGGWLGGLIGVHESTPIPTWAPMMMFALLFGLSMDYEVFLLSRIREEYLRTGDNATAVAHGIARTGRVITAAAAIMVMVFGAFLLADTVLIKVIGLGLAAAVLIDATIVRMVLVPSTMELLGDRNWWMPRWLDRHLPRVNIEHAEAAQVPAPAPALVGTAAAGE